MKKLHLILILGFMVSAQVSSAIDTKKIPVVVITDLYHPYQDPGDNLDLINAFALPEVELRAVILDITDAFRKKVGDHPTLWKDPRGPREAGIIPLEQLNYIFNRQVPYAVGPMSLMLSETDKMPNLPAFEEKGIKLLLQVLRESNEPIEVLSFGSARLLAVAYNREPALIKEKISKIHLSAGTATDNHKMGTDQGANAIPGGEWNVALDVFAFTRLLRSDLPIELYPCAGVDGGFVKDPNDTYWRLPDVSFISGMHPKLQRYIDYAFAQELNYDFLKIFDNTEAPALRFDKYPQPFHFWETAIWMNVTKREIVYSAKGQYELLPPSAIKSGDKIVPYQMRPCKLEVRDDGRFKFTYTQTSNIRIYYREDPELNEKALQQAAPALWRSYTIQN